MVKETFGNRLAQLRREHGLKQEDVAGYLQKHLPKAKTDKSLISRYEANLTKPKQFMTVELLARLFRVNVNYLTGYSDEKYEEEKDCKHIPVLGTIAAGVPMLAQEDIVGEECVRLNDAADFCLRVKGDSMANARIYDGDIVFVRRQETVESGEIAVVMVGDEEATLKRFYNVNGTIFLRPENSKYEEQAITKKDRKNVKILGKAVYFKGEVR